MSHNLSSSTSSPQTQPIFLSEDVVNSYLTWPLVYLAVDQALRSVCDRPAADVSSADKNHQVSSQTMRTFTSLPDESGKNHLFIFVYLRP